MILVSRKGSFSTQHSSSAEGDKKADRKSKSSDKLTQVEPSGIHLSHHSSSNGQKVQFTPD